MTALRQRLIDDLHLRGYAERTVETYVAVVARLAQHFHAAPDQLTEAQLREYLLHLTRERKVARSTLTQALSDLRFFYEQTLGRRWTILDVARPKRDRQLPVVLSRDEVWCAQSTILAADRSPPYSKGMDYRERITIEPGKRSGKPCIRGLRITVYDILDYLAGGMSEDQILADFPDLEREDIRAALAFAADRERRLIADPAA